MSAEHALIGNISAASTMTTQATAVTRFERGGIKGGGVLIAASGVRDDDATAAQRASNPERKITSLVVLDAPSAIQSWITACCSSVSTGRSKGMREPIAGKLQFTFWNSRLWGAVAGDHAGQARVLATRRTDQLEPGHADVEFQASERCAAAVERGSCCIAG
jgi:hypothetical protein